MSLLFSIFFFLTLHNIEVNPPSSVPYFLVALTVGFVAAALILHYKNKIPQKRNFLALLFDNRTRIIALSLVISYVMTAAFAVKASSKEASSYWASFYPSWTSSIIFFTVVGFAAAIASLHRPEKDHYATRVRILASGKTGPAIDYIAGKLQEIGFYSPETIKEYIFEEYREDISAYKVRQITTTYLKNIYDDVSSRDKAMLSITPDEFTNPPNPLGQLVRVTVDTEQKLAVPENITGPYKYGKDIQIATGKGTVVEIEHWTWMKVGEPNELTLRRFTENLKVTLINKIEMGSYLPRIGYHKDDRLQEVHLSYGVTQSIMEKINAAPGVEIPMFHLRSPGIDPLRSNPGKQD
jgi:hypothetical protein